MKTGRELIDEINKASDNNFWWLGQLGYAVKLDGLKLYLDAYLTDNVARQFAPVCKASEIKGADYIFGTHDHSDHIDRPVWKELINSSPNAMFVVPNSLALKLHEELEIPLDRLIGVSDGETVIHDKISITGIAGAHELLEQDEFGEYLCMGYVVRAGGKTIYHMGDTCIYEGLVDKMREIGKIDALFLPINGRDAKRLRSNCIGNMTYQEAVDLCGLIKPKLSVPGHYEMFKHNSENPLLFTDYLDAKYPGLKAWIGNPTEPISF